MPEGAFGSVGGIGQKRLDHGALAVVARRGDEREVLDRQGVRRVDVLEELDAPRAALPGTVDALDLAHLAEAVVEH